MSININFDTGYLTSEEGVGLTALLSAVQPSLLNAAALRAQQEKARGFPNVPFDSHSTNYAPESSPPLDAQNAKVETKPTSADGVAPPTEEPKARRGRKPKEEAPANISAQPENRVDPENPEDTAQDQADEQAETDANRDPDAPLTTEDLKKAMSAYVEKFGMPAAQSDGVSVFKAALGEPPAGQPGWRVSLVGEQGQEALRKAVTAWNDAAASDKRAGG